VLADDPLPELERTGPNWMVGEVFGGFRGKDHRVPQREQGQEGGVSLSHTKDDRVRIWRLDLLDVGVVLRMRMSSGRVRIPLKGGDDVTGGKRISVVEAHPSAQMEHVRLAVRSDVK